MHRQETVRPLRVSRPSANPLDALAAFAVLLALLTLSGCTFPARSTPPATSTASLTISATATLTPQPTPIPLPPRAILVAPSDDPTAALLEPLLAGLSVEAGLGFEHLMELPPDDGGDDLRIAVIVEQMDNLAGLAESSPATQFIAVGVPGLSPSQNLTVIEPLKDRSDDLGFLGGYLAALVSEDWRVASMSEPESISGATTRQAFANGAEFLCGLCRPLFPPYPGFPEDYQIPLPGDTAELQVLLAEIERDRVDVLFVQQGIGDPDLVERLAAAAVRLIGVGVAGSIPSEAWIASIEGDPGRAVASVWGSALTGESGGYLKMPLRVSVYDASRLSPGRLELLQTIIDDLERGFIDTGVNPLTGTAE